MFIKLTRCFEKQEMNSVGLAVDNITGFVSASDGSSRISLRQEVNGLRCIDVKEGFDTIYNMLTEAQNRQQVKTGKDAE